MSGKSRIVKFDSHLLDSLVKELARGGTVRVGIMGDKQLRTGAGEFNPITGHRKALPRSTGIQDQTNADIGALHEYGSLSRGIPARSWLRMPLFRQSMRIVQMVSVNAPEWLKKGGAVVVLKRLGIACENAIQDAFATHGFGTWAPNAPSTIQRKKSSSPLIDTAQLRRSVTSKVVGVA